MKSAMFAAALGATAAQAATWTNGNWSVADDPLAQNIQPSCVRSVIWSSTSTAVFDVTEMSVRTAGPSLFGPTLAHTLNQSIVMDGSRTAAAHDSAARIAANARGIRLITAALLWITAFIATFKFIGILFLSTV